MSTKMKRSCLPILVFLFMVSGCGYTARSLLPTDIKTVRVNNFKSDIKVEAEQNNLRMYRGYRPGMENDITRAVTNKFLTDGTLRIANESSADLVLNSSLVDFKRDALRYDTNENIEEYRIKLSVDMEMRNSKTGAVIWKEKGFTGETTYRTSGPLAKSDDAAVNDAVDDLARRIVERTVEAW